MFKKCMYFIGRSKSIVLKMYFLWFKLFSIRYCIDFYGFFLMDYKIKIFLNKLLLLFIDYVCVIL